jgi:hypothetical protein
MKQKIFKTILFSVAMIVAIAGWDWVDWALNKARGSGG